MIAPTSLARFYCKNGVKRKRIKMTKQLSKFAKDNFDDNIQKILDSLQHARANQMEVVYMDEVVFSKRGFPQRCYSKRGVNISVKQKDVYSGFRTVIAAVNSSYGLLLIDS